MESASPHHNCTKRKSASSPPPQDIHSESPLPNLDIDIDDGERDHAERAAKRPRLSILAPESSSGSNASPQHAKRTNARRRQDSRPNRPSSSSPSPPPEISTQPQQYLLEDSQPRSSSVTVRTGSLLSPVPTSSSAVPSPVSANIIPPHMIFPTITRDTLRELDLESILKNVQLRHDLLFDPGLQFRAVAGKRKLTATDGYWDAIASELQCACTCKMECLCPKIPKGTRPPTPPPWASQYEPYIESQGNSSLKDAHVNSLREHGENKPPKISGPSRVRPMLQELMAVLKCVIAPPPLPSSQPPRPSHLHSLAEAEALLKHIDPVLIEQELRRGIYDPAGLFKLIGQTLKRHCAPMRDKLVDKMVNAALGNPYSVTRVKRTLFAARLCFELLELMKLDIANHQLQHLRPFLACTTPEFLLRIFGDRCRHGLTSPAIVQSFLQSAYDRIATLPIPSYIPAQPYPNTIPPPPRRTKIHLSMIKALSELAFMPPTDLYPETLYLDTSRVALLMADAADLSALYMLIMLWRQLVYWNDGGATDGVKCDTSAFPRSTRKNSKLEPWEVGRIKREIWQICPKRAGSCFFVEDGQCKIPQQYQRLNPMVYDDTKWRDAMENVAVQIASRAEDARLNDDSSQPPPSTTADITSRRVPSQAAVTLMNGWIATHLRRHSQLAPVFRNHLQREVFNAATRITFNGGPTKSITEIVPGPENVALGLESLMPEIRHLGQRVAKLALMNMKVYWSLYEADGFLKDPPSSAING